MCENFYYKKMLGRLLIFLLSIYFFLHICPLPDCIQKSRLISIPRRHLRIQMLNNLLSVLWQDSADRNQIIWVTSEENAVIYL